MSLPSEPLPDPVPKRPGVRPWNRPETEFPALVPVGTLHFPRTEPSEVAITAVLAYSNGFEFFVTRLLRPDGPGFSSGNGPGPPGRRRDGVRQPMTLGLEVADGGQVIGNVPSPHGDEAPPYRILDFGGGVGSLHRSDSRWWTWPLPPPGRLDFICQLGAIERRVSMEAQLILDAAQRSMRVWPDA
ncbi:MAG: hypothetical protein ACRDP7_48265 [Trebonia sp.]